MKWQIQGEKSTILISLQESFGALSWQEVRDFIQDIYQKIEKGTFTLHDQECDWVCDIYK